MDDSNFDKLGADIKAIVNKKPMDAKLAIVLLTDYMSLLHTQIQEIKAEMMSIREAKEQMRGNKPSDGFNLG